MYRNALDPHWLRLLRAHKAGVKTVTPVAIGGTHVGKNGTANHPLSDYGFAHGRLRDHVYAVVSVLGRVAGGGQVGDLLPRGTKVEATTIRSAVPDTRGGGLVFRLCIVKLPHRQTTVAMWIAEPVLR